MKFTVERDALAEAVAWVARALPTRPVLPVLTGLLLSAGQGDAGQGAQSSRSEVGFLTLYSITNSQYNYVDLLCTVASPQTRMVPICRFLPI